MLPLYKEGNLSIFYFERVCCKSTIHMAMVRRVHHLRRRRLQRRQRSGTLPFLLPLIPALTAAEKKEALGAVGAGVGLATKQP